MPRTGMAAASPSAQIVRPIMFSATLSSKARSLSRPSPRSIRSTTLQSQPVPSLQGVHCAGLVGRVIETRFGLHIVRIDRRFEGRVLPFDQVRGQITQALGAALADRAARDFVSELVSRAEIEGIVLEPGGSVLLQEEHKGH